MQHGLADPDSVGHRPVEHASDVLAAAYGDSPAVGDDRVALTFAELDARAAGFAAQLAEHGFGAGDVLAVKLPNRAELLWPCSPPGGSAELGRRVLAGAGEVRAER